jgi:hypothetical protein
VRKVFSPGVILGGIAIVLAGSGSAIAANAITGKDVKNGSLTGVDVKNRSLSTADLSMATVNALKGQTGATGATGPAGPAGAAAPSVFGGAPLRGEVGEKGEKGDTGTQGPAGEDGADGAPGADGSAGPAGAIGPAGPQGDAGSTGPAGAVGPVGPTGPIGPQGLQGQKGDAGAQGPAGVVAPVSADFPVTSIASIGGPINERQTPLGMVEGLAPGTYIVTVDAAFESDTASTDAGLEVYPQVSLFLDKDGDGRLDYSPDPALDEGIISPNAIMPNAANRHISASGVAMVQLTGAQKIGLVAFGYTSTQGNERSGDIDVVRAVVGAMKVAG